jgi:hypothetical protein
MKECSYCGRENEDNATNCSGCGLDEFVSKVAAQPGQIATEDEPRKYNIPPLPPTWVNLLTPHSQFEADIVVGRLTAAGLRARYQISDLMGGWSSKIQEKVVQVRVEDYEAARNLLNAD